MEQKQISDRVKEALKKKVQEHNEKYGNDLAAINIKEKYTIENRENKIYYFLPKSFTQKEILDHIRDDRIGELW